VQDICRSVASGWNASGGHGTASRAASPRPRATSRKTSSRLLRP
jgi:hypothetical protein